MRKQSRVFSKLHFKNLILLYLLVLICAKVGVYREKKCPRCFYEHNNQKTEAENEVNIQKKVMTTEVERARQRSHRRKRVNKKKRSQHQKVRPFFCFCPFYETLSRLFKWSRLEGLGCKERNSDERGISNIQKCKNVYENSNWLSLIHI